MLNIPKFGTVHGWRTALTLLGTLPLLTACGSEEFDTGFTVKSVSYYRRNLDEARTVTEQCKLFLSREYATMNSHEQQAWQDSTDGRNCKTARDVVSTELLRERQRQQRELN
ncbi:hypothetical protein [Massilia sp. TS11]|uniref:hypothetical protein n=1 Tax=Massilia sp. TS11 TaxID=2908003 RepID=UPI001EDC50FE|nr:hypothetical protein [Massilia sp. TS11]MCG2585018.1 hypothetical protein [Massilia sp. TS11]